MKDDYNPFRDCIVIESEHGTGWFVSSKYWNIPCPNEGVANRFAEIIRYAYQAGREDVASNLRDILNVPKRQEGIFTYD